MVPIKWSREALQNLKEIKQYISLDSAYYAKRLVKQIYVSIKILQQHPESGKVVASVRDKQLRRLIVKSYRVIYTFYKSQIFIIAIIHQSKNSSDSFKIDNLFD